MSYTNGLDKPSDYFVSNLHTGNGGTLNITSLDFQPDWVWVKERNNAKDHALYDSVRGANKLLESNKTGLEATTSAGISSFNSDGWTTGDFFQTNDNGDSYVSWNWKAGTSFTNDASATGIGSIDSSGSVNQDAGFSIISYTGTGNAATVSHGLGVAPKMIIIKNRSTTNGWEVYHQSIGNTKYLALNVTDAALASASRWNNTSPTSTVFTVNTEGGVNSSGGNLIAYCFADVQGYSKVGGSYTGNGNADGTFVYTGFKPGFFMAKRIDASDMPWVMIDNKRNSFNALSNTLLANSAEAANTGTDRADFLSQGVKIRTTSGAWNASGASFIFMAFAENPFVTSTGVPATAR